MSGSRIAIGGLVVAAVFGFVALSLQPVSLAQGAPAEGLVPGGAPPDLFLISTGDVIGYVDPCG